MKRILRNRAECTLCHDVIESHRAHDRVWCRCGAIYTDGGKAQHPPAGYIVDERM